MMHETVITKYAAMIVAAMIGAFARPMFDQNRINWSIIGKQIAGGLMICSLIVMTTEYLQANHPTFNINDEFTLAGVVFLSFFSSQILLGIGFLLSKVFPAIAKRMGAKNENS